MCIAVSFDLQVGPPRIRTYPHHLQHRARFSDGLSLHLRRRKKTVALRIPSSRSVQAIGACASQCVCLGVDEATAHLFAPHVLLYITYCIILWSVKIIGRCLRKEPTQGRSPTPPQFLRSKTRCSDALAPLRLV